MNILIALNSNTNISNKPSGNPMVDVWQLN